MLHKTLRSYHKQEPWNEPQEHPDGPLWLIHPDEFNYLPNGTPMESVHGLVYKKLPDVKKDSGDPTPFEKEHGYMSWGLRGR